MVGEDTFYERAEDRDARFADLVHAVTALNPVFIAGADPDGGKAGLAQYLRQTMLMRSAAVVMAAEYVAAGDALCVPGNHEAKLLRALQGRDVTPSHGLAESLEQLAGSRPRFFGTVAAFIDGLVRHLVLDGGKLVVAHAGLRADMQGRASGAVRSFEHSGENDHPFWTKMTTCSGWLRPVGR